MRQDQDAHTAGTAMAAERLAARVSAEITSDFHPCSCSFQRGRATALCYTPLPYLSHSFTLDLADYEH